jgi:hypothetical protein
MTSVHFNYSVLNEDLMSVTCIKTRLNGERRKHFVDWKEANSINIITQLHLDLLSINGCYPFTFEKVEDI